MPTSPATATLLLPASDRCLGQLPRSVAVALGRSNRLHDAEAGRRAQLQRHFHLTPSGWPVAALTRQFDVGDAGRETWLRADPAWVRPDINGARMLACGDALHPLQEDLVAFGHALRPLFGDAGFAFDAPAPSRWYLRLPAGAPLPTFADPDDVLGADLFEHLPDDPQHTAVSRRWRALLSEVQVVLHNHPWNGRRLAMGKPPINSLWFWGAGMMPEAVVSNNARVCSDDILVHALVRAGKREHAELPEHFELSDANTLLDLHAVDPFALNDDWLAPAVEATRGGRLARLVVDCGDGVRFELGPSQRWRFWRKLDPASLGNRQVRT